MGMLNIIRDKNDWKSSRKTRYVNWINLFSESSYSDGVNTGIKYSVTEVPTDILVDRQGDIRMSCWIFGR